jgi:hypothetical protein
MSTTASHPSRDAASFRDPSGFIFRHNHTFYRQVNQSYQDNYDRLMSSGLYEALVDANLLIPHKEVAKTNAPEPKLAYQVIKPEQLAFISYPYEWSFSQLQDAALATLQIQKIALDHGMSLKDASANNIQFLGGKPVFIDTLSFEAYEERPWVAYGQFCQHFLGPLVAMSLTDIRLGKLLREYVDGIPLDLVVKLLPATARLKPTLLAHIYMHAGSRVKHAKPEPGKKLQPATMSRRSLDGLLDSLQSAVSGLKWRIPKTEWADYYAANNNYQDKAMKAKHKLVKQFVQVFKPTSVWDLGGNTGEFSRLFSEDGIDTVCWDIDPVAVEMNYQVAKKNEETHLYPVLQDFTNPSPSLGWNLEERLSLIDRGPADVCLALALVHHMAIANNVPLDLVATFMRGLSKRGLVIEFIPKEDSQVQLLLSSREDIFDQYTKEGFEAAFSKFFKIKDQKLIPGSKRTLYAMECK